MIVLFLYFSRSIIINQDNSEIYFANFKHIPVFAILVSDWCPHCMEISPMIDELILDYQNDSQVVIAKINCDSDKILCKRFPEMYTPGLYWVRTIPEESDTYNGAIKLSDLKSFIDKHISPSVLHIFNETQYIESLNKYKESSIFVIQSSSPDIVDTMNTISLQFTDFPCFTFHLSFKLNLSESDLLFNVFPLTGITVSYDGNYSYDSLYHFYSSFALPPYGSISHKFFSHSSETGQTVLILSDEAPYFQQSLLELTKDFPPDLRSAIMYCGNNPRLCMQLIVPTGKGPFLLMYNPSRKLRWHYKNRMQPDLIIQWVNDVLQSRVRPAGSGAGFSGFLMELLDNAHRAGTVSFILMVSVFAVFILIFVFGFVNTWYTQYRTRVSKLE